METFRLLEQAYFWLTGMAVVPVYVLSDAFISMYLGARYVLPKILLVFMCIDLYIHINQDSCFSFLTAKGLFRERRNISIGGALINVVVSLLLMKPFGTAGILAGTAVSQLYYWAARSVVAFRDCLKQDWKALAGYWLRQAGLLGVILLAIAVSSFVTQRVFVLSSVVTFVFNGVICEACFAALALLCCHGMEAERRLEGILLGMLKKRMKRA